MDHERILESANEYCSYLRDLPQYRIALDDSIITREDLQFLAVFEKTREAVYRPGHGAITQVLKGVSIMTGKPERDAEELMLSLESRVLDHYHSVQLLFGKYAEIPQHKV